MILKVFRSVPLFLLLFTVSAQAETLNDTTVPGTDTLEKRLERLEALVREQQRIIEQLKANNDGADDVSTEPVAVNSDSEPTDTDARGLNISGFFDVQAKSHNHSEKTFEFGDLEIDLEYIHDDHYSASAALVWDGEESSDVAVAVIDYHLFDDNIPPRGRIFIDPGFHLQMGRFDVPFGSDYQYFASVDRPNISTPLTTERIQGGGYNGDGLRAYASWSDFEGAIFWTNSLYSETGYSIGGRFGLSLSHTKYSFHHRDIGRDIEIGLSYLLDRDGSGNQRNKIYALDLTLRYEAVTLVGEYYDRINDESLDVAVEPGSLTQDETAFHLTLVANMQDFWHQPITLIGRYERWIPDYSFIRDAEDDALYQVNDLSRVTIGMNYQFTDYFRLKLEYYDYLGDMTEEPDFEKDLGLMQVVVNF